MTLASRGVGRGVALGLGEAGATVGKPFTDHQAREWKLASELQAPNSGPRYQVWERAYHVPNEQVFEFESMLDSMEELSARPDTFRCQVVTCIALNYNICSAFADSRSSIFMALVREPFNKTSKRMSRHTIN